MKATLHLFLCIMLFSSLVVHAQQFSPTTGVPCETCHPANYVMTGGPDISDPSRPGGSATKAWNIPGFSALPVPPSTYSQSLPANQGKNTFATLAVSEGGLNDKLNLTVSGFDVNKEYTFRYSVLSGSVNTPGLGSSPFGESAKMDIVTAGQQPALVATQTTNFTSANQNKWITQSVKFVPITSTLTFRLSGKTVGNVAGYINFDIDKYPFDCMLPNTAVQLAKSTVHTLFASAKLNLLNDVIVLSNAPATSELVWKSGPNSTDPTLTTQEASSAPICNSDPANVKPYYAFYYAKDFNCYTGNTSQAELKFLHIPTQVTLKGSNVMLACPQTTADLTLLEDNPLAQVRWFNNNAHSGLPVFDAKAVPPGDYYAFYYDWTSSTYSLLTGQTSNAHVKVENSVIPGTPDLGPTLDINSLIFPANGSKDFVVNIYNSAENSNCSVFFRILKLPGFTITYSTAAGTSNVNGGVFNNNDFWTFSEDANFITVTSKTGIAANGYSAIGFKITRKANTPANSAQNITVTIPQQGGGGEINTANNAVMNTVTGI